MYPLPPQQKSKNKVYGSGQPVSPPAGDDEPADFGPPPAPCVEGMPDDSAWQDINGNDCAKYAKRGVCDADWVPKMAVGGVDARMACCASCGEGRGTHGHEHRKRPVARPSSFNAKAEL